MFPQAARSHPGRVVCPSYVMDVCVMFWPYVVVWWYEVVV